jgi:hypothetical protein
MFGYVLFGISVYSIINLCILYPKTFYKFTTGQATNDFFDKSWDSMSEFDKKIYVEMYKFGFIMFLTFFISIIFSIKHLL